MMLTNILTKLFGAGADSHAAVRPLWHRVVELARAPAWYRAGGIADNVTGRFDAITLVAALVMLRMEASADMEVPSVRLTELFVEDMDGQLRESGMGDLVVGKHIGRLLSVLGGRLGALRDAIGDQAALTEVLARNLTLNEGAIPDVAAAMAQALAGVLAGLDDAALMAGHIPTPEVLA